MIADNILVAAELASAAFSQGPPQTIETLIVDPKALAVGYGTTPVVGSPVPYDAGEAAGRVDDLIVAPGGKAPPWAETVIVFADRRGVDAAGLDRDLCHDADDARQAADILLGSITLILPLASAGQVPPALFDRDLDRIAGNRDIPKEAVDRSRCDLLVAALDAERQFDLDFFGDRFDALYATGRNLSSEFLGKTCRHGRRAQ
jgi:hypothetical protein